MPVKPIATLLLVLLGSCNLVAQSISGFVLDATTGDTLAGAIVKCGQQLYTSNPQGYYSIQPAAESERVEFFYAGYESYTIYLSKTNDRRSQNIYLKPETLLDEVVISAGRFEQKRSELTVSMDLIKPELIQQKNATQLDQIVTQVPGVTVQDGQASIRGGSGFSYGAGSRVLMLLDDMPLISADAGDIKWSFLPIEMVEQVEVVKGASSVLYGSGALNGVIHLRTRYARDLPYTQCTSFWGSYDAPKKTYKWWNGTTQFQKGFQLTHIQKIKNHEFAFSGQYFQDDGYRMFENEDRKRVHGSWKTLVPKIPGLSNTLSGAILENKGGIFYLWQHYDSAYIPQGRQLQAFYSINANLDNTLSYVNTGKQYKITWRNRYYYTTNLSSAAHSEYSELQFQKQIKNRWVYNSGIIGIQSKTESATLYGNHVGKQAAFYNQLDISSIKRFHFTAGIRLEYASLDQETSAFNWFGSTLPIVPVLRLGSNYEIWKGANLRASYGQGYRFPSTAEKFVNTGISVLKIFPNPNLKPEQGENMELGIKQGFVLGSIKGQCDVAAFWTRYQNMIEFVFNYYHSDPYLPLSDKLNYYGFRSENLGKSDIKGLEISQTLFYKYKQFSLQAMGGYTFINPIKPDFLISRDTLGLNYPFLDTAQFNILKYRSKHLLKWDVMVTYKKIALGWSSRYQSRILNIDNRFIKPVFYELGNGFEADDAPSILPGLKTHWNEFSKAFWVHDARLQFQLTPAWTLALIVNNITNTSYQNRPGDLRAPTLYQLQVSYKPQYQKR